MKLTFEKRIVGVIFYVNTKLSQALKKRTISISKYIYAIYKKTPAKLWLEQIGVMYLGDKKTTIHIT